MPKKKKFHILFLELTGRHIIFSLKNLFFCKNFVSKSYFAIIISVLSTPIWEKGRIRSWIRISDYWIRIREAKNIRIPNTRLWSCHVPYEEIPAVIPTFIFFSCPSALGFENPSFLHRYGVFHLNGAESLCYSPFLNQMEIPTGWHKHFL